MGLAGSKPAGIAPQVMQARISLSPPLHAYPRTTIAWDALAYPVPPLVIAVATWYRNINLLSIAYALRPRLRSRLTLSRLALLRNPWAFGGGVSHSSFVTRASILTSQPSTAACRVPLRRTGNAPLPLRASAKSVASVSSLSPVELSAPDHLTSELLRTLSRVAASKPTSWLCRHSDIVGHLAST